MTDDIIATDAHRLVSNSSALISVYELEFNGVTYYFHSENKEGDIIFDGNTYINFPMILEGVEFNADGAANRPSLTIANVKSLLDSATKTDIGFPSDFVLDDLIGARITRRETLEKYTGTGVTAYEFPRDVYVLDRITNRTQLFVQIELASPFDFGGRRVPSRIVTSKYCIWQYKGFNATDNEDTRSACRWSASAASLGRLFYFTIDDEPLLLESISSITGAAAWNISASYSSDEIVTDADGNYWASRTAINEENEPSSGSLNWQQVRTYSSWSSDSAARVYTVSSLDPRDTSYVHHSGDIWRAIRTHTKDTANAVPGVNTLYWEPGDTCGKLLQSCKVRYQAIPANTSGSALESVPKVSAFDTSQVLPFGGFPGTSKIR